MAFSPVHLDCRRPRLQKRSLRVGAGSVNTGDRCVNRKTHACPTSVKLGRTSDCFKAANSFEAAWRVFKRTIKGWCSRHNVSVLASWLLSKDAATHSNTAVLYLSERFCLTAPPARAPPIGPKETGMVTSKCLPKKVQSSDLLPCSTQARHTLGTKRRVGVHSVGCVCVAIEA